MQKPPGGGFMDGEEKQLLHLIERGLSRIYALLGLILIVLFIGLFVS